MFRREQRSGDAQGGTADDGPGVVSQVVSQVVKNAPAREAVAAGTAARAAAEAMESSWSVARGKSRRRKWTNGKCHCSKLGSGLRGRDGFSGSSRLTCQRNRMQGCESGWAASLTSTVCQLEVRCRR